MEPQRVGTESAKHLSLTFSCEGPVQTRHQLRFARRSLDRMHTEEVSSVDITLGSRASTYIPRTAGGLRDQSEYVSPARCGAGEDSIPRQLHKCHSRLGYVLATYPSEDAIQSALCLSHKQQARMSPHLHI